MKVLHIDSSIQGSASATRELTREIVAHRRARGIPRRRRARHRRSAYFTIPSQLKAWLDRILIEGRTFRYTEHGPEGLAGGKQVILAVARGGVYEAGSSAEFGESCLKFVLGFSASAR